MGIEMPMSGASLASQANAKAGKMSRGLGKGPDSSDEEEVQKFRSKVEMLE